MTLVEFADRLQGVKWQRDREGFEARCPGHDDKTPSLSVNLGDDGRLLVHCHAGCDTASVMESVGFTMADLFPQQGRGRPVPPSTRRAGKGEVATYPYPDENGVLLYEVVRYEPKDFRQRQPDGQGGWVWNLKGVQRVLYRLPEVLEAAAAGQTIFVVEGEKDADALTSAGYYATTCPGGAGKWRPEFTETLRDASVIVVADADEPGRRHAENVRQALDGTARDVAVVEPAEGYKDTADHLGAGYGVADFVPVEAASAVDTAEASNNVVTEAPAPDLFKIWSMPELLAQDLTWEWVVKGMLANPTFGQIAGELKTLKSYILMFIALGIASGQPIFDRFTVDRPGPVVLYVGEGGRIPWTRRLIRCAKPMGIDHPEALPIFPTFDVAPVGSPVFEESLARDLHHHKPVLFALDPWYAYHGPDVKASDLHQEGAHLNRLRQPVEEAGANMLIVNHFNQTGTGNNLRRITQAGSGEWVDSWLLTSHRENPDVNAGKFRLRLEVGSRQWGGDTLDLDLNIGSFDHDAGVHDGEITWGIKTGTASARTTGGGRERAKLEIERVIRDHPREMTRTQILEKIGGNKATAQHAFDELAEAGSIRCEKIAGPDRNGRMITRPRWLPRLSALPDAEAVE